MFRRLRTSFRTNVIAGVLVLAPIGAVLGIILWLWNIVMGLSEFLPPSVGPKALLGIDNPAGAKAVDFLTMVFVFGVILLVVSVVGLVSRNYLGKRVIGSISRFVARVPVLSAVYATLEQLLKTFASGHSKNFRRVVEVEYPRKGLHTLAFVTGEKDGFLKIYVPTTPNPTSGFYLWISADDVRDAELSVEDALKEIISMGIVQPK